MKRVDIITRAGRNLRQAKIRTLLTALAISVGAFTITLALAAGTGGKLYTDSLIKNNGDARNLSVYAKDPSQEDSDKPKPYEPTVGAASRQGLLGQADVAKISRVDGVESVSPMYSVTAAYMVGPNDKKYQTTVSVKVDQTAVPLTAGSLTNNQPDKGKVVIAESYVEPLGFASPHDAIGKTVTLHVVQQGAPEVVSESKDIPLYSSGRQKDGHGGALQRGCADRERRCQRNCRFSKPRRRRKLLRCCGTREVGRRCQSGPRCDPEVRLSSLFAPRCSTGAIYVCQCCHGRCGRVWRAGDIGFNLWHYQHTVHFGS